MGAPDMNQSVVKALNLLDFFSEEEKELSLSDLATKSGIPRPTAYRLLTSLETCGFLIKTRSTDQHVKYRLGLKLLELGSLVAEQLELRSIALPQMQELCADINEVVHLLIRDGDEAIYIEKVESRQALRLHARIGIRSELYIGAGPKLLLAYTSEQEREKYIEEIVFTKVTEDTISDTETLSKEIKKIQSNGFSISKGERDIDTIGISYPIYNYTGEVIAALNVSGPTTRINEGNIEAIQLKVCKAAAVISKLLGYTDGFYKED